MIKLDFTQYQEKLGEEKLAKQIPTEHVFEDEYNFFLYFRSRERIDYYSILSKSDIFDFSTENGISRSEAIEQFKINYCYNSLPIDESPIYLPIPVEEVFPEAFDEPASVEKTIEAGDDIVEEADGYSDFLMRTFNKYEKRVLAATNKLDLQKSYTTKSFGDFLKDMFNTVNTVTFARQVKKYLKVDLLSGMESAETELNMDIGFTDNYEDKLNQLQAQQVDGYTINGKKWPGIKGVTKEIQSKIIKVVQDGVSQNKSLKDVKSEIQKVFDNFSEWRSEMIARTETNRVINEGKLMGYKESGLDGVKVWIAAPYEAGRSSDVCQSLNNQVRALDEDFVDSHTLKSYSVPPAHQHCRSTIIFRAK